MKIIVLGGTGFIGQHICERLVRAGHEVTVPTRRMQTAREIQMLPRLQPVLCDVHDATQLAQAAAGHEVLINLVAILHGSEASFEHAHHSLPQKIATVAQRVGVRRIVHISSLGVALDAPSQYLRSKARGEQALADSGIETHILRPSVVFGTGDKLLNTFAQLQRLFPIMPLAGADSRYQPVWVEDMAQAAVQLATDNHYQNNSKLSNKYGGNHSISPFLYEIAGQHALTLRDLVQLAGRCVGAQRPVLALPAALAKLQALCMELMPGPTLISRDNLLSMQVPNVASGQLPGLSDLGIEPASIFEIAPRYLQPARALDEFRKRAH